MNILNIGFLASHSGSNMQAIIDNAKNGIIKSNLCAVISNNSNSVALQRAADANIPAYHVSEATHQNRVSQRIIEIFDSHNVDLIVLAGYMKLLEPIVIEHFNGRVLNIHPALLPKYGGKGMYGMNVHKAVIEAKEKVSGATIHLVSPEYDKGRILSQMQVPVLENDSPEALADRVLKIEHILYSDTIKKIELGEIQL